MTTGPEKDEAFTPGPLFGAVGLHDDQGSVPRLYTLNQPNVEALLKDLYIRNNDKINNPLHAIFGTLRQGISYSLSIIEGIVNRITGDNQLFLFVDHALDHITAWRDDLMRILGNPVGLGSGSFDLQQALHNLLDNNLLPLGKLAELDLFGKLKPGQEPQKLDDIIDRFWGEVFGDDNAAGHTINDFRDAVRNLFNLSDGAASGAGTALALLNFGKSQPIWLHINPTMQAPFGILHLRKYTASGSVVSTATDPESVPITQTTSAGMFDRFDKSRDCDLLTIFCKATGTITAAIVHLWRMDTTTGDISFIRSETITPAALPTASFDNFYVPLGGAIHTDPGTVIGREIAITGSGTLAISGVTVPWLKDDLSARPRRHGFSRPVNAGAIPPATIADASIPYSTAIPNIGLGQQLSTLPPLKFSYADPFNAASNWRALAGSIRISGGVYQTGVSGVNFGLFLPAVNSDQARVEFDLRTVWTLLNPDFNQGDQIRLLMFCSANASQWVGVEIEANARAINPFAAPDLRIVSGSGVGSARTLRSTDTGGIAASSNDRIAFAYTQATNTYSMYINNSTTPAKTWIDSGNVIQHGAGFRQAAIYASYGSTASPVCDNFVFKDL